MKNDEPRHGLTQAERQRLVERHVEVMEQRKFEEDLRLLDIIKAGQILARAKER